MPEMERALEAQLTGDRRRKLLDASTAYMRGEIDVEQLEASEKQYALNLPSVLRILTRRRMSHEEEKRSPRNKNNR